MYLLRWNYMGNFKQFWGKDWIKFERTAFFISSAISDLLIGQIFAQEEFSDGLMIFISKSVEFCASIDMTLS